MIRRLALGGALVFGTASSPAFATAKATTIFTAQQTISAPDQSHLIGFKNGSITAPEEAQIDACVVAFLDGKPAAFTAAETLKLHDEVFQKFERDTCTETATLPSGESYCHKYGPRQNLVGIMTRLKSQLSGRAIQFFCLTTGDDLAIAIEVREKSLGAFFVRTE